MEIRTKILDLATRAAGVSRREVRDSFNGPRRAEVYDVLAKMLADGEIMEAIRNTNQTGRPQRRLFVERGAGQRWSAGVAMPRQKPKPPTVKPEVCPSGKDYRYTVSALPEGYQSQIDPSQARPWAVAAAGD